MRETDGLSSLRDRSRELMGSSDVREEESEPPGPERAPPPDKGSMWDRVAEASTIAPVHGDHSIEPANEPWELAMMAGWGDPDERGRGHDALGGVEDLLLGKVDAMEELGADLEDGGSPLQLTEEERMDTRIEADRGLRVGDEDDWCSHL